MRSLTLAVLSFLSLFVFISDAFAQPARVCRGSHRGRIFARPPDPELKISVCARDEPEASLRAARLIGYGVELYVRANVGGCRDLAARCGNLNCPNQQDACRLEVASEQLRLDGFRCTNTEAACRQDGPDPPRGTTCWECVALKPVFDFTCACKCGAPEFKAPTCNP